MNISSLLDGSTFDGGMADAGAMDGAVLDAPAASHTGHGSSQGGSHGSSHGSSQSSGHITRSSLSSPDTHGVKASAKGGATGGTAGGSTGASTGGADAAAGREPGAFGKVTFADMNLAQPLLDVLIEEGYEKPTPIQAKAIPVAMTGRDILGSAQTGTGKTAAFALPILHRLHTQAADKNRRGPTLPRALVLAPTRELADQIGESLMTYGRRTTLRHACVYGGVSMFHQVRALRGGVDVLVATPGRLMDLMEQGHADLSAVEVFVLDEADRMLDMGFIQPIKRIAGALTSPKPRQTMLFSATMPSAIRQLASALLRDPQQIAVATVASTAAQIEQKAYYVDTARKLSLLLHLLGAEGDENAATRAVVFTRTKFGAERLAGQLERQGVSADAIHGNKAQNQRKKALESFRSGRVRVLVATDVAARGLDVDDVSHVFNYDLPMEPEGYVHRIGRTGRAGSSGIAISFVTPADADELRQIQRITKATIHVVTQLPPGLVKIARGSDREDEGEGRSFGAGGHASERGGGHAMSGPARPRGHSQGFQDRRPAGGGFDRRDDRNDRGPDRGGAGVIRPESRPEPQFGPRSEPQFAPRGDTRGPSRGETRAPAREDTRAPAREDGAARMTRSDVGLPPKEDFRGPRGPRPARDGGDRRGPSDRGGFGGGGGGYAPRVSSGGPGGPGRGTGGPGRGPGAGPGGPGRGPGGPGRGPGGPGRGPGGPGRGPSGGGRGPSGGGGGRGPAGGQRGSGGGSRGR